ncbi:unnamed protein product [Closterium sp. Naga37s-1]|nr:unnamed protein product [Closterium sp. Naga37s-1]
MNAPNVEIYGRRFRGAGDTAAFLGTQESGANRDGGVRGNGGKGTARNEPRRGAFQYGGFRVGVESGRGFGRFGSGGAEVVWMESTPGSRGGVGGSERAGLGGAGLGTSMGAELGAAGLGSGAGASLVGGGLGGGGGELALGELATGQYILEPGGELDLGAWGLESEGGEVALGACTLEPGWEQPLGVSGWAPGGGLDLGLCILEPGGKVDLGAWVLEPGGEVALEACTLEPGGEMEAGYGRGDSNGVGGVDGGLHGPDGSAGRAGVGGSSFSTDDDVNIGPPGRSVEEGFGSAERGRVPFDVDALLQRAREGYTPATINTGVNQGTAGARRGTDWRSIALDEEDQLHSGLA